MILFLDLDEALRQPIGGDEFINHPRDQQAIEGALKALKYCRQEKHYLCIGITNQESVAAGHKTLTSMIFEQRVTLQMFPQLQCVYAAIDSGGKECYAITGNTTFKHRHSDLRKPKEAAIYCYWEDIGLDRDSLRRESWMIGDSDESAKCAENAGINFMNAQQWRDNGGKLEDTIEISGLTEQIN